MQQARPTATAPALPKAPPNADQQLGARLDEVREQLKANSAPGQKGIDKSGSFMARDEGFEVAGAAEKPAGTLLDDIKTHGEHPNIWWGVKDWT